MPVVKAETALGQAAGQRSSPARVIHALPSAPSAGTQTSPAPQLSAPGLAGQTRKALLHAGGSIVSPPVTAHVPGSRRAPSAVSLHEPPLWEQHGRPLSCWQAPLALAWWTSLVPLQSLVSYQQL